MSALDLFGTAPTAADPLIGQALCMTETCACGTNVAVVVAGRGPHAAELHCRNCDRHWQWLSQIDFQTLRAVLAEITSHFGAPTEIKYSLIKQRSNTMTYEQHDNSAILFRNDDKNRDTDRDYKGEATVGGTKFWISGWIKTGKRGKFLTLSFKPKDAAKAQAPGGGEPDFDDTIPF